LEVPVNAAFTKTTPVFGAGVGVGPSVGVAVGRGVGVAVALGVVGVAVAVGRGVGVGTGATVPETLRLHNWIDPPSTAPRRLFSMVAVA
jgi:hypothetical protein